MARNVGPNMRAKRDRRFKSPKTRGRSGVHAMMKFQSAGSKLWNFARQGSDRLIASSGRRVTERAKREGEKGSGKRENHRIRNSQRDLRREIKWRMLRKRGFAFRMGNRNCVKRLRQSRKDQVGNIIQRLCSPLMLNLEDLFKR